jgi:WD40 repeat protein
MRGAGGDFPGWTPGGRAVLTAAEGVARLWDADTGAVRARFPGKGGDREEFTVAVLSPDGRFVAVQDGDATVRLVRVSTGRTVAVLEGSVLPERGFSRDGRQLVLEAAPDGLRIYDVPSGRLVRVIRLRLAVYDAAFSPDGRRLITGGEGDTARIWDVRSGRLSLELGGHGSDIEGVSFSPDGKLALTASEDSTARLWDAATGRVLAVLAGHAGVVRFAGFTPDGRFVVTASDDVRVWEVAGGAAAVLRGHEGPVISARFSPDGRSLISSNVGDGSVRVWDVATRRERSVLRPPRSPGTRLDTFAGFSADGRLAVTSGLRTGRVGPPGPLREQEPARLWDLETGKVRVEFPPPPGEGEKLGFGCPALGAALSPDGTRLATVAECDGTLRVWDVAKGALLKTVKLGRHGEGVAWTPDGSKIVATAEARVHVVDANSFRKIRVVGPKEGPGGLLPAVSPEIDRRGALVALGYVDRTARVWELATGRLVAELAHAAPVLGVAFSPNGQFLVAASGDAPTIWDLESQRPLVQLFGHSGGVAAVDFSPDGSSIVSGGVDRSIRIWRCEVCAPIDEVLRLARSRVLRELTPAERARFLR